MHTTQHTGTLSPPITHSPLSTLSLAVSRCAHYSKHWHSKPTHEQSAAIISSPPYAFICVFCIKLYNVKHTSGTASDWCPTFRDNTVTSKRGPQSTTGSLAQFRAPLDCHTSLHRGCLARASFLPSLLGSSGSASSNFVCRRQSGALLCFV